MKTDEMQEWADKVEDSNAKADPQTQKLYKE